ncbi:MAG: MarR family winged helix-turn-helix transcriptional regulator [Rhizobiaceae bacterium]
MSNAGHNNNALPKARLRLWLRLLKAQRLIEAELREKLRIEYGSTLPRFDVLAALHRAERGLKMSELSDELMVSNGNVTGIVDRLVEDGTVVRVPVDGDRRAMRVKLTDEGRNYFRKLADEHEGWVSDLLAMFDEGTAEELAARLHTIADSNTEHEVNK